MKKVLFTAALALVTVGQLSAQTQQSPAQRQTSPKGMPGQPVPRAVKPTVTTTPSKTGEKPKTTTAAPAPTPKPATNAGSLQRMTVNGITVLFKPAANDVVVAEMCIRGGVANYGKNQEGIESLALNLAFSGGTKNTSKTDFASKLERLSSSISPNAGTDYSTVTIRSVRANWDQTWALFADALNNPLMDEKDFEQRKQQTLAGLSQSEADPDAYLRQMMGDEVFAGSPYHNRPGGSTKSVKDLKASDATAHYKKIAERSRIFFVVVGNVSAEDVKRKIMDATTSLPQGTYSPATMKPMFQTFTQNSVKKEEREIATNYIMGVLAAPLENNKEGYAMRLASNMLQDRLFDEIRTKRNLSYAPGAGYRASGAPYSMVYVSTTKPNEAVKVMSDELRKIRKEGFRADELRDSKEGMTTNMFLQEETNAGQADALTRMEVLGGGAENLGRYMDQVRAVTLDDVNAVVKKYMNNIRWVYLGKTEGLDEKVFTEKL